MTDEPPSADEPASGEGPRTRPRWRRLRFAVGQLRVLLALAIGAMANIFGNLSWRLYPFGSPRARDYAVLTAGLTALTLLVLPVRVPWPGRRRPWHPAPRQLAAQLAIALVLAELLLGHGPLRYYPGYLWRTSPRETNSRALRGPEPSVAPPPGTTRILALGCSVTFGYGTERAEDTYPLQLERILRERHPGLAVEVLNAGIHGFSSFQGLTRLRDELVRFEPDLVLTYFGHHEMLMRRTDGDDWARWRPGPLRRFLIEHSHTVEAFHLLRWVYLRGTERNLGDGMAPVLLANYRRNMDEMEAVAVEHGFDLWETIPVEGYDGPCARVFPVPAWREERLLDVHPDFAARGDRCGELFLDGIHLTVEGNRVLAEALARELVAHGALPVAAGGGADPGTGVPDTGVPDGAGVDPR